MEEDGTGAVSQLTSFQKDVLHGLAAYDSKYTARALTDFAHGTVDEVSRALDALCDADIVTRSGSGGDDELFWIGEEPDGEPIMEPGAAPAGWQQPPRPQQSGGRAKAPAKTKTASKRRAGAPKKESDMDRFRREGKALFDSMPRVDGGLALAPGYAGGLRAEDTWTAPPTDPFPDDPTAIPSQQERDAAYARAKNAFLLLDYNKDDQYRCEVPDALAKGKEFDGDPRMPDGAHWNDWQRDPRAMAKAQPRLGAKGNLTPPDWFLENRRLSPRAVMAFLGGDGSLSFKKDSGVCLSIGLKCTFENIMFLLGVRRCIGTGGVTVRSVPTDNYYVTVTYCSRHETVQKFVATHCYGAVPRGDIMALARLSLRYCRVRVSRDPERMQREEQAKLQAKKVLAFVSNAANKKKDLPDEGTPERITRFENQLKAGGKAAFMEWFAFFVLADGSVMIGGEYKIEFFQSDKSFLEAVKRVLKTHGFDFAVYDVGYRLDSFAGDGYDRRKPFTGCVLGSNARCHELAKALLPFYQGHWDQVHHTAKAVALMASSAKPGVVREAYDQMMIGVSDSKRTAAKKRKRRRAPAPAPARAPAPAVPVPAPAAPPPGTLDEGWGITPLNFAALESLLS